MSYSHAADENLGPFDAPGWWHEADVIHCDSNLFDSDKIVAMHRAGAWRELDLAWPEQGPNTVDTDSDNTVVFANFKQDDSK